MLMKAITQWKLFGDCIVSDQMKKHARLNDFEQTDYTTRDIAQWNTYQPVPALPKLLVSAARNMNSQNTTETQAKRSRPQWNTIAPQQQHRGGN